MNPKILAVLLIALILVQYSYQDAVSAAPRAKADKSKADTARTIKTDQTKPTPMYTQVAATPAWGRGYGLPVDWNHDGIIDWRDGWGWNQPLGWDNGWNNGWNGAWNPGWEWNGAYEGWRAPVAPVISEPVVARRLGARLDTSSLLEVGEQLDEFSVSYVQQSGSFDEYDPDYEKNKSKSNKGNKGKNDRGQPDRGKPEKDKPDRRQQGRDEPQRGKPDRQQKNRDEPQRGRQDRGKQDRDGSQRGKQDRDGPQRGPSNKDAGVPSHKEVFDELDKNHKGYLTASEMSSILKEFGEDIPASEIEKGLKEMGVKDGRITPDIFEQMVGIE